MRDWLPPCAVVPDGMAVWLVDPATLMMFGQSPGTWGAGIVVPVNR